MPLRLLSACLAILLATITDVVALRAAEPAASGGELPFLSPIFGDNMVLQRGKPNRFWGWANPGENVSVTVADKRATTAAAADGKWSVTVEVPPAGGPYVMEIAGPKKVTLRNVLVGDVWLCSGQSNMAFALRDSARGAEEIRAANVPTLRLYTVAARPAYHPADVPQGEWKTCSPETAGEFSAVAYYFARRLEADLHVPIGLIQSAVGGSPAESWVSAEAAGAVGDFTPQLAEIRRLDGKPGPRHGSFLMHWLDEFDAGSQSKTWAAPDFDDTAWQSMRMPGIFADAGVLKGTGVCWVRREITLPDDAPTGAAKIFLGEIDKMDTAYVNGRWVGASSWVENPRAYTIPAGVLRPGRNAIAIRVFTVSARGGIRATPETLRLQLANGTTLPLAGEWKGRVSVDSSVRPPLDLENYPTMPTVLFNSMIAPVSPLAFTGVIWYQGEANTTRAAQYRKLLPALISDWRARFQQGDFPFYIVSLPRFMAHRAQPGRDGWTELREAQALTAKTVSNSGLAVTIDLGEADNIHPKEKKPVGERLALLALAKHYGKDVACSGPIYRSLEREGHALRIKFDHADGGLVMRGDKLEEFSVAGPDHQWHWATAKIDGDAVVISSADVPEPVAVRYAWQANPKATLFNARGLPAMPFRADE